MDRCNGFVSKCILKFIFVKKGIFYFLIHSIITNIYYSNYE